MELVGLTNLLVQFISQFSIAKFLIYRINGCLKWRKVRLYDGHSCLNHCLLSLVSLCHYVSSCFLANLDGGLNQQCL